jgi:hypothetical protein
MSKLPPPPPFDDGEDEDDLDDDGSNGVHDDDDESVDLLAPTQDVEALSFTRDFDVSSPLASTPDVTEGKFRVMAPTQDFDASSPDLLAPTQDVAVGTPVRHDRWYLLVVTYVTWQGGSSLSGLTHLPPHPGQRRILIVTFQPLRARE